MHTLRKQGELAITVVPGSNSFAMGFISMTEEQWCHFLAVLLIGYLGNSTSYAPYEIQ